MMLCRVNIYCWMIIGFGALGMGYTGNYFILDTGMYVFRHPVFMKSKFPKNVKGGIGSLFDPVLMLWGGGQIAIIYGVELLYLRIWRNHSVRSVTCAHYRYRMIHCAITNMRA